MISGPGGDVSISMKDLLAMDIGNYSGQIRKRIPSLSDAQEESRHPSQRYVPYSDLPDPNTITQMSNEQTWAQQPFVGPLSPAMYGAMKRGSKIRASYIPYEKYGKRRYASYPRKRAYAKRTYARKKYGKRHYYKSYYVRGTLANVKRFGPTWKRASKTQRAARTRHRYYGRGKYGVFRNVYNFVKQPSFQHGFQQGVAAGADLLGAGASAAKFVAPEFAAPLSAAAGVAGVASGYMGRGTYASGMGRNWAIKASQEDRRFNQLFLGGDPNTPVMQSSGSDGSLIVSHRELVQEIYGAGSVGASSPSGFEVQTLTVNPGLERVFPWLSQLAANFEEYEIIQCVFEYEGKKMVGTTDELTIHGTVTAAHKFNFKAQEFQDKHEMQSYPHANQCQAHDSLVHGVEADPSKIVGDGHKFIRLGGLLATDDQRDFDHATFSLAQSNIPAELASKEIGCLYVAYTVKLMKPKLHANRGLGIKAFRALCTHSTPIQLTSNAQTYGVLGTSYDERADGSTSVLAPFAKNTLDIAVKPHLALDLKTSWTGVEDNAFCFPPNASGVYKVIIRLENNDTLIQDINAASTWGSIAPELSNAVHLVGQITSVPTMGAGGATTASSVGHISITQNDYRAILEFTIKVRPQVGNVTNFIALNKFGDSGQVAQACIEITEYNTFGEDVPTIGR